MHPAVAAALANADDVRSWQEELYRDLHQHPELSHQEHRTAAAVADRLQQTGFEVTTGVGGTGVVGILRNGEGATVLLRADMDALPVLEDTGLPYASTATGRPLGSDRPVPVAHACGHDMHTTCLLGAAQLLALAQKNWANADRAVPARRGDRQRRSGDGRRRAGGVGRPRRRRARPARGAAACRHPRRRRVHSSPQPTASG